MTLRAHTCSLHPNTSSSTSQKPFVRRRSSQANSALRPRSSGGDTGDALPGLRDDFACRGEQFGEVIDGADQPAPRPPRRRLAAASCLPRWRSRSVFARARFSARFALTSSRSAASAATVVAPHRRDGRGRRAADLGQVRAGSGPARDGDSRVRRRRARGRRSGMQRTGRADRGEPQLLAYQKRLPAGLP
jgi:hypothetical protein